MEPLLATNSKRWSVPLCADRCWKNCHFSVTDLLRAFSFLKSNVFCWAVIRRISVFRNRTRAIPQDRNVAVTPIQNNKQLIYRRGHDQAALSIFVLAQQTPRGFTNAGAIVPISPPPPPGQICRGSTAQSRIRWRCRSLPPSRAHSTSRTVAACTTCSHGVFTRGRFSLLSEYSFSRAGLSVGGKKPVRIITITVCGNGNHEQRRKTHIT